MPIPERLRPPTPTEQEMREFMELGDKIETALEWREDASELLARWNARAGRDYVPSDFNYHGAIDRDTFVAEMLLGAPAFVPDLTHAEALEVLRSMLAGELSEAVDGYFLAWCEVNVPGANVSDLLHWPDQWFGSEIEGELSAEQFLAYAMARSGRQLPGAPTDVPMPYPMPTG
jgi:hypothetical protein